MNKLRFLLIVLLSACIILGCCCCIAPTSTMEITTTQPVVTTTTTANPLAKAYKENPNLYVLFYRSTAPRNHYVSIEDISSYNTLYPDYNGTWFKKQLSGEDLCIYNAYLYAMEHQFIGFTIYVEDSSRSFQHIRNALSLDSPLLEQNLNWLGEYIYENPINWRGKSISVRVEQFTETRWQKKAEAIEQCKKIVEDIPKECTTTLQKMEYLYRYTYEHITYTKYDRMVDEDHLYDAVCKGEAVCDGYSNMLNLLVNLIGVESYEVIGATKKYDATVFEETNNDSAHTWVVAKIDGEFYNFDPTFEDGKPDEWSDQLLYFGFSDDLISYPYLCLENYRPKCTDLSRDFPYAELVIDNITSTTSLQKILALTDKKLKEGNSKKPLLIAIRDLPSENEFDQFMQAYASAVPRSIKQLKTCRTYIQNSLFLEIEIFLR